jgi:hypothetical protein
MQQIKEALEKHTIVVLNEALKRGFTQIPNYVLRDSKLSFGARLVYAVLLSYAWQEDSCFPGQQRIADDLGCSRQMVNKYLVELQQRSYVSWKRNGLGKTNVYYILDFKPLNLLNSEPDVNHSLHQDVK